MVLIETALLTVIFISFLLIWMIAVFFYTPACLNLKAITDDLNKYGELKKTKAPMIWYISNFHVLDAWIIPLSQHDKYLKYKVVARTCNKIRVYRKVLAFILLITLISGFTLLMLKA